MIEIPNCRQIIPLVDELTITVPLNDSTEFYEVVNGRNANTFDYFMPYTTQLQLPWYPLSAQSVEIYKDGVRIINGSHNFDETHLKYEINGDTVIFKEPIAGNIVVISDLEIAPRVPDEYIIAVDNLQGGETTSTDSDQTYASTWCEPVVCTQPYHGFARLTDDRKSIIYVPDQGYDGPDSFSYTVITQRGQIAEPKCIYITVGDSEDLN